MPPKRALWTEEDLVSAVRAVERGLMSTYKAAERYRIPRRTIRNHLKTGSLKKSLGRKAVLNEEQEAELVTRIIRYAEIGLPLIPKILRRLVYRFCELNNIKHNFNEISKLAGKDWLKSFMKRHPEISKRKAQFMNPARAQKLNKFIVDDHFAKIRKVYDEMDLKNHPEKIYNMDEKGCRLTVHHQQIVLAKKGTKRVHLQSSEHAESVTVAGCVNALGTAIPPMVIFKGKRLKPELFDNLPPGSLVEKSTKGYMTNELFKEFLKHLAKYKTAGKCLLIFDGAACHLDLSIVDIADSLDINLYCLPSNTTHELQPLDKAVYRSFEHHWDAEVLSFMDQNRDKKLTKARFNIILSNVWSKCMTHSNITSGFRATGLYPLNPEAIPETAYAPSVLTEVPLRQESEASLLSVSTAPHSTITDNADKENVQPSVSPTVPTPDPCIRTPPERNVISPVASTSAGIVQTPIIRSAGRYYNTVYSSSSSDEEDRVPLAQIKTKFHQLLPTPVKTTQTTPTIRRKAINYRGTPVTKDLFSDKDKGKKEVTKTVPTKKKKTASTTKRSRKNSTTPQEQVSWYCHACEEDKMVDMRYCVKCGKWYHEECVGLTADDVDAFECPDGC